MITAVLLDVDGTLIDSNDAHADAWIEALRASGLHRRFEDVRSLIGMGADRLLPLLAGVDSTSELGRHIAAEHDRLFVDAYLPKLKPFPGARDLLLELKNRGLDLAVASSSEPTILPRVLAKAGIADLLQPDLPAAGGGTENSKPSPDILSQALASLGRAPREALMIGDTPYDIEAASRAGVVAIALLCGGWTAQNLQGAAGIFKDPRDLLLHLDLALGETAFDRNGDAGADDGFSSVLPL